MRINTRIEMIWSDRQSRYILVRKLSGKWTGPVAFCKGASGAQQNLANQQASFYQTLQQDYGQQFQNQSAILGALNNSLSPIVQAGINQFGFNTAETNALNSQAIQGTAQQYANASQNLKQNQAAQGGGNALLPSGVASQQNAQLAAAGANTESNALLGIQQAGYAQGRQNYENAVGQLGGVASAYNPTGYGGLANSAGQGAFGSATTIQQMNNQASPWNLFGGVLGGLAGGVGNALAGGLGGSSPQVQSGYGQDPLGLQTGQGPGGSFGMGFLGGGAPDLSAF